jgi:predicted nucleic acid-binding protein
MRSQVLVDSSAWVEVLRNRAAPALRQSVEAALHEGRAALTAPVWVELYRGVRGKRELQQLDSLRKLCQWLDFDDDCWQLAAKTARQCREGGATVPLGDVLVFACARRHGVEIIEHDAHFAQIAKATKT